MLTKIALCCYRSTICRQISSKVVVKDEIHIKDLSDLFSGKIAALKIPNFCPPVAVQSAMEKIKARSISEYANAKGVGKFVGTAYFETQESEEMKNIYYETRLANFQELRTIFFPFFLLSIKFASF